MKRITLLLLLSLAGVSMPSRADDAGIHLKIGDGACSAWAMADDRRYTQWTGTCRDGLADGPGVLTGEWRDDKGVWHALRYEGRLAGGKRSGFARARFETYGEYTGQFREGNLEGWALMRMDDGTTYEGQWRKGRQHGVGTLVTKGGQVVRGRWTDGVLGARLQEGSDGRSWSTFAPHADGTGAGVFNNGGEIEAGTYRERDDRWIREGRGVFHFEDAGSFYIGEFAGDLPNGSGVFFKADKGNPADASVYGGQFHQGCLWRGNYYTNVIVAADSCRRR